MKFDNVLNDQRHVIFSQRNNVINTKEIFDYSEGFLKEIIEKLLILKEKNISKTQSNEFSNQLKSILGKSFNETEIKDLSNSNNDDFKKIIEEKFKEKRNERIQYLGNAEAQEIEKRIFLQTIDLSWKSHIQYLEQLRQVIGLRSYGQRDPLIEYKKEAFNLFENLLNKLKSDLITILINLTIIEKKAEKLENQMESSGQFKADKIDPKYIGKKMRRNEPCFCGSKKKYKHCCGAL